MGHTARLPILEAFLVFCYAAASLSTWAQQVSAQASEPPTQISITCLTGRQLSAALINPDVSSALLPVDVELSDADYAGLSLPINLERNFTIKGTAEDPSTINFKFLKKKVQLGSGVTLTFQNVLFYNWRSLSRPPQARGFDWLVSALDARNFSMEMFTLPTVRIVNALWFLEIFYPIETARLLQQTQLHQRPVEIPGINSYDIPVPPPKDPATCSNSTSAPPLWRCLMFAGRYNEFAWYGMDVLPGDTPSPTSYLIHVTNVTWITASLYPADCIANMGVLACTLYYNGLLLSAMNRTSNGTFSVPTTASPPPPMSGVTPAAGPGTQGGADKATGVGDHNSSLEGRGRLLVAVLVGTIGGALLIAGILGATVYFLWWRRRGRPHRAGTTCCLLPTYRAADPPASEPSTAVGKGPAGNSISSSAQPSKLDAPFSMGDFGAGSSSGKGACVAAGSAGPQGAVLGAAAGRGARQLIREHSNDVTSEFTSEQLLMLTIPQLSVSTTMPSPGQLHIHLLSAGKSSSDGDLVTPLSLRRPDVQMNVQVTHAGRQHPFLASSRRTQPQGEQPSHVGPAAAVTAPGGSEGESDSASVDAIEKGGNDGGGLVTLLPGILGRGAFGSVHRGVYRGLPVAVKIIEASLAGIGRGFGAGSGSAGAASEKQQQLLLPSTLASLAAVGGSGASSSLLQQLQRVRSTRSSAAEAAGKECCPGIAEEAAEGEGDGNDDGVLAAAAVSNMPDSGVRLAAGQRDDGERSVATFTANAMVQQRQGGTDNEAAMARPPASVDGARSGDSDGGGAGGRNTAAAAAVTVTVGGRARPCVITTAAAAPGGGVSTATADGVDTVEGNVLGSSVGCTGHSARGVGVVCSAAGFDSSGSHVGCGDSSFGYKGTTSCLKQQIDSTAQQQEWRQKEAAKAAKEEVMLAREVEILGRCSHPNVVRLLAACLTPPRYCLVLELMETSLHSLIYDRPGVLLPMSKVLHIAIQVCQGLEYLHPTIVHRDLKPANVLISGADTPCPVVKLADFGLSRLRFETLPTLQPQAGTPVYLAPECMDATNNMVTHRADMYSVGVLLWAMLTGQAPWRDVHLVVLACKLTAGERLPLDEDLLPGERCPAPLRQLMRWCWEQDPLRRPAAVEALRVLVLLQQRQRHHEDEGEQRWKQQHQQQELD